MEKKNCENFFLIKIKKKRRREDRDETLTRYVKAEDEWEENKLFSLINFMVD